MHFDLSDESVYLLLHLGDFAHVCSTTPTVISHNSHEFKPAIDASLDLLP